MGAVLLLAACTGTADGPEGSSARSADPAVEATADPAAQAVTADVATTFATYRSAVSQGDGAAAVGQLSEASVEGMARLADLAESADEDTVRGLPAADQLIVLTYRLRPALLEEPDPYRALIDAGLAGQDRSLGDLGEVQLVDDDLAVGTVTDSTTGAETPLRWRFVREGEAWRFDLLNAHHLLSQSISNGATNYQVPVDQIVTATLADLSGEDAETIAGLYSTPPA